MRRLNSYVWNLQLQLNYSKYLVSMLLFFFSFGLFEPKAKTQLNNVSAYLTKICFLK